MEIKYTFENKNNLIEDIKKLEGYEGYIQFSDIKIRDCDIFKKDENIASKIQLTSGFVYEAHFCNGTESIAIKQINNGWLVSTTQLSEIQDATKDIQTYQAIDGHEVNMAQIWKPENDPFCENIPVMKLKKVVFTGFEGEENE